MKTALRPNEEMLKSGPANLQRGIETVGGKLYLTNQRLIFESHKFNIQTGETLIALSDIQSIRKCWTKFLNLIPLFPNSLAVHTKQGKEYCFVLWNRKTWAAAIEGNQSA